MRGYGDGALNAFAMRDGTGTRMNSRRLAAVLAPLMVSLICGAAHGASFDCDGAKRQAERMICADAVVSKLDEQLDATYRDAMAGAVDQPGLAKDQRLWIAERNRCANAACLAAVYRERIAHVGHTPRAGWATDSNPRLGIACD